MKTITFLVKTPLDIPAISKEYRNLQMSDTFLGKARAINGNIVNTLVIYDFKNNKWIFGMSGHVELIEYYI